jgi:hypothetical protein
VNTTGAVFLGLTVGCAQCHDHKFDPISQRDYYQLFAFFNDVDEPTLDLPTPQQREQREQIRARISQLHEQVRPLETTTAATVAQWEHSLPAPARFRLPGNIQDILALADNSREPEQQEALLAFCRKLELARHALGGLGDPLGFLTAAHAETAVLRADVEKQIAELKEREPRITTTMVVRERPTPRPTHVHLGGDFLRQGAEVRPDVPAVLPPLRARAEAARPNRIDLARWLVSPENPLTARVMMNRVWQHDFGLGLVETENDFGLQGTPPSHPELLDWLASEFVARGWGLKAMHRLIVTSATYRQSSHSRPELVQRDPRNRLLARQSRLRLEAETVRDAALEASGLLARRIGGPSVFPPQPEGVYRFTQIRREWKPSDGPARFRRGMYTYFWRSAPHPALMVFDAPESTTTCTRRNRSNTPLQALTLLNDEGFFELARGLAVRVLKESRPDTVERIRYAFRLCLGRPPAERELDRLAELLAQQATAEGTSAGPGGELAPWVGLARVLLNLDEFITRE